MTASLASLQGLSLTSWGKFTFLFFLFQFFLSIAFYSDPLSNKKKHKIKKTTFGRTNFCLQLLFSFFSGATSIQWGICQNETYRTEQDPEHAAAPVWKAIPPSSVAWEGGPALKRRRGGKNQYYQSYKKAIGTHAGSLAARLCPSFEQPGLCQWGPRWNTGLAIKPPLTHKPQCHISAHDVFPAGQKCVVPVYL